MTAPAVNVRAGRQPPGLRPQHAHGIALVARMFSAHTTGVGPGSDRVRCRRVIGCSQEQDKMNTIIAINPSVYNVVSSTRSHSPPDWFTTASAPPSFERAPGGDAEIVAAFQPSYSVDTKAPSNT
jgi:hypothetical protein